MLRTFLASALTISLLLAGSLPADAALLAVSGKPATPGGPLTAILAGGNPADVQLSLANGFPIWYQDTTGMKLEMCLEQGTGFCLTGEPFVRSPISFPNNFGAEQFYWTADAATTFRSTDDAPLALRSLLLVSSLEAGFLFGFPSEGDQAVFARIRLRGTLPEPRAGTGVSSVYEIRHPFGGIAQFTIPPAALLLERTLNETQDIGNILGMPPDFLGPQPGNFLLALRNGPAPPEPAPAGQPPLPAPRVDDLDRSIGPFLTWDTFPVGDPLLTDNRYVGKPEQENPLLPPGSGAFIPLTHAIAGSPVNDNPCPVGNNCFQVTLTNPPAGFFLDDANLSNTITLSDFVVAGKIYNDGANIAPTANPDFASGAAGAPVLINVVANDLDVIDPATNVHGINRQAISLDPLGGYRSLTTTAKGGTVTRDTPFTTGLTTIRYQPTDGFTGIDTFQYVVQDTGGLVSQPAQVAVTVDALAVRPVSVRPKLMKWDIRGTSSLAALQTTDAVGNTVVFTPLSGAQVPPAGAGPIDTPGTGSFTATIIPAGVGTFDIDFTLEARNLPTAITLAHIHSGAVGVEGGVLVDLFVPGPGETFPADGVLTGTATGVPQATVDAILAGNTYVNVHTADFGAGEIRGQFGRNVVIARNGADLAAPVIGVAAVRDDLTWALPGKLNLIPGQVGVISAQSSAGGQALNLPVKMR